MYFTQLSRFSILPFLPNNGIVVEIGVAKGDFSGEILVKNKPKVLHMIDPWEHQEREDYQTDFNNASMDEQEKRFQDVSKKFKAFTNQKRAVIHRDYSTNIAKSFEDKSLDWIFIDGLHSYEGVKADLHAFKDKVKDDGFIVGHDYTNHVSAQAMGFGVIEAVNEFVQESDYELVLMTWENFPSYFLTKNPDNQATNHLIGSVTLAGKGILSLPDYPEKMTFSHPAVQANGVTMYLPTFSTKPSPD